MGTEDGVDRSCAKAHLAYEVTNISYWRQTFENCGFDVLNGIPIPVYERFEFRDPFGNRVERIAKTTDAGLETESA